PLLPLPHDGIAGHHRRQDQGHQEEPEEGATHHARDRTGRGSLLDRQDAGQWDGDEEQGEHDHGANHELVSPELAELLPDDAPEAPLHRVTSTSSPTSWRYTSSS